MFSRSIRKSSILLLLLLFFVSIFPNGVKGNENETLLLGSSSDEINLYPVIYMLKDDKRAFTIHEISSLDFDEKFVLSKDLAQHRGFFDTTTWIRFTVDNRSSESEWLLEIANSSAYQINFYSLDESGITELSKTGANFPFEQRDIKHRNFIFSLEIEPQSTKIFYLNIHSGGDYRPAFNLWKADSFIQKTQIEFILLGFFYGLAIVMVLYNLFLFFSLRMTSYLYYVLVITCSIMANLQNNGLAFQYLWPNYPMWNSIANPFFVSLACIFILLFTRSFLETDRYLPRFKSIAMILIILNSLVIAFIFLSKMIALNIMLLSTFSTFTTVLTVAFICLKRGARQARFFIIGWCFFLVGVLITIFMTAAVIPHSYLTEYAGQITMAIEVVLLSLALADKINIMRVEKELAEIEVKESQALALETLRQTDELKDEFLAVTSHELRTPLHGMIGIAESLRDGVIGEVPAEMNHQLSMIITSGNRLSHLINDILDFSKLNHDSLDVSLKPVYLSGIADAVCTICQPLVKNKPIRLINGITSTLPPVIADKNRLQQILYNLIGNAIKYTEEGEVTVSAENLGDLIKISVTDTGKGIATEQLDTIFEPFQQGDVSLSRDVGGTGIGLTITKQLIDLHGGKIEVDSKVNSGSTFSFTLPVQSHNENLEEVASTIDPFLHEDFDLFIPKVQSVNQSAKILIADDEPINLQVLMNQLTLEGYEVITASNGEEALRIVDEESIELLILDIMMPKMSGYEVCRRLRKKYSLIELPILMLTAKSQVRDKVTSFEVGANDYLAKPCDKQELLARVHTLIRLRSLNQELLTINLHLEEKVQERTQALEVANTNLTKVNDDLTDMAESRRQLLSNIAHELGTPVTLIHSYVQALQEGLVATNDSYYTNLVYDKISVLSRLINDLSDLSKLEAGQTSLDLKVTNLYSWLEQIVQKLEFDVPQYGRIFEGMNVSGNLKSFCCLIDLDRMDQVFSNLVINAVKNTSKTNGKISISMELDESNEIIVLKVKDNGYGISEDHLPFIFERFYKETHPNADDKQSGTGLGLAIVKEIIQGHGGSILVESEVDVGSTFYISLAVQNLTKFTKENEAAEISTMN